MTKYLLGVVAGVFVAAFTIELMSRKSPHLLASVRFGAAKAARDIRRAFSEGYQSAAPAEAQIEVTAREAGFEHRPA